MEKGVPIRSISRSITVLQAINRQGSVSMMDVARLSKLAYPTACRIIQTLMHEGLVESVPNRKRYRATAMAQTLSRGFDNHDKLVIGARPFINALTRKIIWPVFLSTRVGASMMVRDSTQALTSLTHELHLPGYSMPLLECAAGHVWLGVSSDEERAAMLADLARPRGSAPLLSTFRLDSTVERIRDQGYAIFEGRSPSSDCEGISSIGVPIHEAARPAGVLTLDFFTSAMSMDVALERYLDDLKETASLITRTLTIEPARRVDEEAVRPAARIALRSNGATTEGAPAIA